MTTAASSELSDISRRVLRVQVLTIAWMTVEAVVSLAAAWNSHSPALFAFGGDSLVELLSAAVVFWRFRFDLKEARAARIALPWISRGAAEFRGNRNPAGRRSWNALARRSETTLGSHYFECRPESRRNRICTLRLYGLDRSCGIDCEHHLG
jgi:hypothetical protein